MLGLQKMILFQGLTKGSLDIGEADDDNLEGRNYDRIWKYPEYLVFGAGEGTIEQRFDKR